MFQTNKKYVIGIDECGYGALAGPIYVGAVRVPTNWSFPGLTDSKALSFKKRANLSNQLKQANISYSIVYYEANKLDTFHKEGKNIGNALRELYLQAINNLDQTDSEIVLDGIHKIEGIDHISLPKADSLVQAVSAASVLAKVERDNRMIELSSHYPDYGFDKHMGYGTAKHLDALKKFGLSAIHRRCYKVKSLENLYANENK